MHLRQFRAISPESSPSACVQSLPALASDGLFAPLPKSTRISIARTPIKSKQAVQVSRVEFTEQLKHLLANLRFTLELIVTRDSTIHLRFRLPPRAGDSAFTMSFLADLFYVS